MLKVLRGLGLGLGLAVAAFAAAPTYGTVRTLAQGAYVFEGANAHSKVVGSAADGDEFELRGDKLYDGFYKIQYGKQVAFVWGGQVELLEKAPFPTAGATAMAIEASATAPEPTPVAASKSSPIAVATLVSVRTTGEPVPEASAMPGKGLVPMITPTLVPTSRPSPAPGSVATLSPVPAPPADTVSAAQGRRRTGARVATPPVVARPPVARPARHGWIEQPPARPNAVVVPGSVGSGSVLAPRDPAKLSSVSIYMALGGGKNMGSVEPAFKPGAGVPDVRNIESGGFVGLGVELRSGWRWLRYSGDWTYFSHRTKAADKAISAFKVGLPASVSPTVFFPDSDVYYVMQTHAFRAGLKASLPFARVEPWINATAGLYVWNAEYLSGTREWTYGNDAGVALGATAGLGVDFHFPMAHAVFTLTPFLEWGAPVVNPKVADIAGIGQDWIDPYGTPLAPQSRAGLQLAIGY